MLGGGLLRSDTMENELLDTGVSVLFDDSTLADGALDVSLEDE